METAAVVGNRSISNIWFSHLKQRIVVAGMKDTNSHRFCGGELQLWLIRNLSPAQDCVNHGRRGLTANLFQAALPCFVPGPNDSWRETQR